MVVMESVCGVEVSEVAQVLATSNSAAYRCLVIDCRSFLAFNQSRILDSVNIHCPPILKRRSGGFIALENIVPCETKRAQLLQGVFSTVLVYDENTHDLLSVPSDSNLLSVITSLLKQVDKLSVRFIKGGFEAIREECPILCLDLRLSHPVRDKPSHQDRGRQARMSEPSEILPHVYLGDVSHSAQQQLLDQLGITALLNVSSSCHNHFQTSYTYKNVTVSDNMDADLISWFPELIDFIETVSSQRGRVLVHCRAGVSRSATVCIAYIMHKQGLSLDSAYEFVKSRRPVIDPNINFIRQLQKFEALLKARPQSHSTSRATRANSPAPLLLGLPPCSLAYSLQTHSAPLLACSGPGSRHLQQPSTPHVFTFSPGKLHDQQHITATTSSSSSSSTSLSSSPPPAYEHAQIEMEISSPSPTTSCHFVYPSGAQLRPQPPPPPAPSLTSQSLPLPPSSPVSSPLPSQHRERSSSPQPEQRLSPCSLSQTAASPSPVCHPPVINVSRPGSLPLLQISTPLTPLHDRSPSQHRTDLLPSPLQNQSTPFLPSPLQHPTTSLLLSPALRSPHISFFPHGPEEGTEASALNYPDVPSTPREKRKFTFFGGESPEQTGATTPLDGLPPSQHRPPSPTRSPYLGPERNFSASASLPRSPVSPLGFPLSPLHSPLPSCG